MSDPPGPPAIVPDKLTHASLYAGLALLLVRALAGGLGRPLTAGAAAAAVIAATLYGVTDEIHQRFVPLRQMEVLRSRRRRARRVRRVLGALRVESGPDP